MKTIPVRLLVPLMLIFLVGGGVLRAQDAEVTWKILTSSITGAPGDVVDVKVQATIPKGWHMYTTKTYPADALGPQSTEVTVGPKGKLSMAGKLKGPKAVSKEDENFEGLVTEYWNGGTITLTVPVKIPKNAAAGSIEGWVNFYYMYCSESQCMPPQDRKLTFAVTVEEEKKDTTVAAGTKDTVATTIAAADTVTADTASTPVDTAATDGATTDTAAAVPATGGDEAAAAGAPVDETQAEIRAARQEGLLAFLALAALHGLFALATPCVYPMIPITVSFFTKRKQATKGRSIRDAGLYSLGIISTFTALGLLVTVAFGANGIGNMASDPWVNLMIAAIYFVLALNLFGMFEIQLPTSVLNKLNSKADGDGVGAVILMGLVFSLTSFTCTVPFVSSLLLLAAEGDFLWPLLGTAAFATVFSAPFFILALFPAALKTMPKAGGWLNSVKVVMGFVEVALAIKFLSNTDMTLDWGIFTREIVLAIWIAVAALVTFYLLGRFQLPHDTPVERVGPIRVLFAVGFLAIGFWLLQGLFGGNLGEVDAQIPPPTGSPLMVTAGAAPASTSVAHAPPQSGAGVAGGAAAPAPATPAGVEYEHGWIKDNYEFALAEAKRTGKPVFVDFTGYTCTNCRWMERNMFPRDEIASLLSKYVLVRLYTDRRNEINQRNQQMQRERFRTVALPYYVLMTPSDSVIAGTSYTRDAEEFAGFLKRGLGGTEVAMR